MRINLFLRSLGLASGVSLALAGPPSEVTEPVRVLNAAVPEGQGNAAASTPWKKLAGDAASCFHSSD